MTQDCEECFCHDYEFAEPLPSQKKHSRSCIGVLTVAIREFLQIRQEYVIDLLKDNDIQIKFEEPYENTRKHSKFNLEDLVVVPVEIEADSAI